MTASHKNERSPAARADPRDAANREWTDEQEIELSDERRIPTRKVPGPTKVTPARPLAGVRRGPTRAPTNNGQIPAEAKQVRLLPGRRVPGTRYRLVRWLGEGGMGVVYEAEHEDIERRVALKILRPEASEDPHQAAQFREEARAASRIGSPNIVEIFDFGELPDGRLMFAMELLGGHGLDGELDKCPMDQGRLIGILRQVCKGLSAAHEVGIVHRDVKPDNIILVTHQGRPDWVKVVDFGIATMHADADAGAAGTPHYMAPEQVLGQSFDGRLDMYSLGCTAYELLVGKPPFIAQTVDEILQMQLETLPMPPSQRCAEGSVHPALEAVILRCLAKDPARRYADMRDLEAALCEAQIAAGLHTGWDDLPLPEVELERLERIRRDMPQQGFGRPRRWLWPAIAAASTLAAAGLALALVMLRGVAPEEQDLVDKLATAARVAAGKAHWVYPPPDDRDETALIRTHELEAIEGSAAALADARGAELRAEFAAGLVRIGDQYWVLDGGKPFARDYYMQALLFDPNNQHARERTGSLLYGLLGDFQDRALKGEFSDEELRGAGLLRDLASTDEDQRIKALQDYADDPASTSVTIANQAGRLLSSSRGGRKTKKREADEASSKADGPAAPDGPAQPVPEVSNDAGSGKSAGSPSTKRDVKQSQKLVKDARAALASGNRKEAESLFHQAIAADNRNAGALIGLSDLEFDKGAHQRAADYAEKAVAAAPKNGTYRLKLGDAYYKLLRYTDARRAYELAQEYGVREADERLAKLKSKLGQ